MRIVRTTLICSCICLLLLGFVSSSYAKQLSFEDRVAYQKAIEQVYWNHTIWPAENPQPKPGLKAMITDEQIRMKVAEYLRKSAALAYMHVPITGRQMQGEMDRIATETRDAAVLRELFAALNNDPYVIAECLARPLLLDRISMRHTNIEMLQESPSYDYHLPTIKAGNLFEPAAMAFPESSGTWHATTINAAPAARHQHTAVWTGTEMIVWGGESFANSGNLKSGSRYNPSTNSWSSTNTTGAPSARFSHTAVWTGTRMIIWGGQGSGEFNTGGRYNPAVNSWNSTTTTNAPSARFSHTAVWTGSLMIVWGGYGGLGARNTGGRYNPSTNSWNSTTTTGAPSARLDHTAVWTGSRMIVWGGHDSSSLLNTGGRYNPSTNSWSPTATPGPSARWGHTAVWAGNRMIIWGGNLSLTGSNYTNTGSRYDPSTNSWQAITTTGAPAKRASHAAVSTGNLMIVWGGFGLVSGVSTYFNSGARYDPSINSWTATTTTNAPTGREFPTAIWTGSQMIVWGGLAGSTVKTGGRYTP